MSLIEEVNNKLKQAMKDKDEDSLDALRAIKSAFNYKKAEAGNEPDDAQIMALIRKEAKKREDSIEQFKLAGRNDLVDRESAQLKIIARFLPEAIDDSIIEAKVKEIIDELGATSKKEMGAVMNRVMKDLAGAADGKKVNRIVSRLLG